MTSLRDLIGSARAELPAAALARWSSIFFSLSVLTFLISVAASQAFLTAASLGYALHLLHDRSTLHFPPVKLPLALFCLTTFISIGWAENPTVGWFAVRKLVFFLIWLLGVNLVASSKHLEILYRALFVESAVAGLVAAGQFVAQYRAVRALHPDRIYFYMTLERIHGFMGHWMNFGGQQMLVFAALLAYLLLAPGVAAGFPIKSGPVSPGPVELGGENAGRHGDKGASTVHRAGKIWWVVLAIVATSIVLNFTRGVWLGCFVAAVYLVASWRPPWLWALPSLLVVGYLAAPSVLRQRVEVLRHPSADPSLAIRFEMWQVGLRMIQTHPLVGVGPNNIEQVYMLYLPPGEVPVVGYHEHLHNDFLQLGAERGLPCLAAWVWLMTALGWHYGKMRRQLIRGKWVTDAAIAGLLALLVEGCFEFNFGTSPVLMLFLFVASTPFVAERQERPSLKGVGSRE